MNVDSSTLSAAPPRSRLRARRLALLFGLAAQACVALIAREGEARFADGSHLHGSLNSIARDGAVRWTHPFAAEPFDVPQTNLAWIRFEYSRAVEPAAPPTCRFQFQNQDEIYGRLTSLSNDTIELDTWFGNHLEAPRATVRSITFLAKNFSVLYEGPSSLEGWSAGKNPPVWEYQDGALIASGLGTIGRDFQLKDSASLEFDLEWTGPFNLIVPIYARSIDRFDYGSSCYMFYIRPGSVSLQRVEAGVGTLNLGREETPETLTRQSARFEIRANREEKTLTVFLDGRLVHQWKDSAGFVGEGTGILFYAQLNGPKLKIRNIKVSEGIGRTMIDAVDAELAEDDWIYLTNRDKASGEIQEIDESKVVFSGFGAEIQVPLDRVAQVIFGDAPVESLEPSARAVRAQFVGGGTVTFEIEEWAAGRLSGRSPTFGSVVFEPDSIRRLEFSDPSSQSSAENASGTDWDVDEDKAE